eukprot:Skav220016  [mRNA]  locus=scaffold947:368487:369057:+ [translate_table: standard]
MAPLDSADGALRSMCRVVAKLLHPEKSDDASEVTELSQKILNEEPKTSPRGTPTSQKDVSQLPAPGNSELPPSTAPAKTEPEQPGPLGPAKGNPAGLPEWAKEEAPTVPQCGKLQCDQRDLLGVLPCLAGHRRLTLKPAGNFLFS